MRVTISAVSRHTRHGPPTIADSIGPRPSATTWRFEWLVDGTSTDEATATLTEGDENADFVRRATRAIEGWEFGASTTPERYRVFGTVSFRFDD